VNLNGTRYCSPSGVPVSTPTSNVSSRELGQLLPASEGEALHAHEVVEEHRPAVEQAEAQLLKRPPRVVIAPFAPPAASGMLF
jgi:hypothetical protein